MTHECFQKKSLNRLLRELSAEKLCKKKLNRLLRDLSVQKLLKLSVLCSSWEVVYRSEGGLAPKVDFFSCKHCGGGSGAEPASVRTCVRESGPATPHFLTLKSTKTKFAGPLAQGVLDPQHEGLEVCWFK